MHVFFEPNLEDNLITLSEEESKHCIRVLRLKKGDTLNLANGIGTNATAIITDDHVKKCVLQIINREENAKFNNYYLHVLIAPTKNSDRTDWFIEKATELGIDEITFIETKNCERAKVNLDRCNKIAVSAMKQSKQWWLPKINGITKFTDVISGVNNDNLKLIAWCNANIEHTFKELINPSSNRNIVFCIGPEGDFTQHEVETALVQNFNAVSLGKSILRTETAALYAVSAIKTLFS